MTPEPPLQSLPLVTLYLTERCNSRCVSCDYWRHGSKDMTLEAVTRWLPEFEALGTRAILVSGGEPLLNPEWPQIARLLRSRGLKLMLLSSGLSLAKHAMQVADFFESVTVSMDGTCAATYAAIRGLDAFDTVCDGVRAAVKQGLPARLRVTVQRANYRELPAFVTLAHELGASGVSFLAADVSNPHAFGRSLPQGIADDIALRPGDLPEFDRVLDKMALEHGAEFLSGFIAESPQKLRRIREYFAGVCAAGAFPAVKCNAPEFSAVIEADGTVRPCFFIPGTGATANAGLRGALNDPLMKRLRADIRQRRRSECASCVCSMWRDPASAWDVPS